MLAALSLGVAAALAAPVSAVKPAAPGMKVSYEKQIQPLLVAKCYACHGNGTRLGDFQIDSREGILTGGKTHPVVLPGNSAKSYLIRLVNGEIPGKVMPARGPRLSKAEVGLLRAWIDQGLSFGDAKSASAWKPQLALRAPAVPAAAPGSGLTNPIDLLLQPYYRTNKVPAAPVVDDRTYARRVYLDLIGMLPTPAELREFLNDGKPGKRVRLAERLLADKQRYAEHWITFWNDALRNDYTGTGYIDGGRLQITGWLYQALVENLPYDRFVAELVNPNRESAGFTKGIVWRGVVNASQMPHMQAAQNISQVFMGVNLKCASCHDSFINNWKLADSYGMAGIYADQPLEMVRCDKATGKVAPIKFLYPELGAIDGSAPKEKRWEQLAALLTSKANGRLPRTMVNRLWAKLLGRGLVEPADEMDNRPWDPNVLDWLASDFVEHGYDVKQVLLRIVTSRAYQLPTASLASERAEFVFTGPVAKRLSAEQFVDAVSSLTGVWSQPASQFQISRGKVVLPSGNRAQVKFESGVLKSGSREIDVDITGAQVLSLVVTDGGDTGNSDWADWIQPRLVGPQGEVPLTSLKWRSASTGYGAVQLNQSIVQKPLRLDGKTYPQGIGTHANSVITYMLPEGITRFRATVGPDSGAVEMPASPTSIAFYVLTGDRTLVETRAALAVADPLTRALGRPNREQTVTQRQSVATTLQALELTNGQRLAGMLETGAARWTEDSRRTPDEVVTVLYLHALSRPPKPAERAAALELLGSPMRKDGAEDLLWVLLMLPEFQLY